MHQVAYRLHKMRVPLIPRLIDYVIFLVFNSVIHYSTPIGRGTRCVHRGVSVLIHRDSIIGRDVTIGPHAMVRSRVGDRAHIGARAFVWGDEVGEDAIIGAGTVLLKNVPPGRRAVGNPARILPPKEWAESGEETEIEAGG
jgi:serine O-acetyltransferase